MLAVMQICFLVLKSNPSPSPHSAGLRLGRDVLCPGHLEISLSECVSKRQELHARRVEAQPFIPRVWGYGLDMGLTISL